jgi:hypothetical protein
MKARFLLATVIVAAFFVCAPALVKAQFNSGFSDPFNPNQNTQANSSSSSSTTTIAPATTDDATPINTGSTTYSSYSYFRCGSSHYHLRTYDDYDHCCPYTRHHTTSVPFDGWIWMLLGVAVLYGFKKAHDRKKRLAASEPAL